MQTITTIVILGLLGQPPTDQQAADKQRLQGHWKVVSAKTTDPDEEANQAKQKKIVATWTLQFKGDLLVVFVNGVAQARFSCKLDPSSTPKQLDMLNRESDSPDIPMPGIYAFAEDRLKLSWSHRKARPTSFEDPRSRQVSLILERMKE